MRQSYSLAILTLLSLTVFAHAHSDVLLRSDGSQVLIGAAADLGMEEGGPFYDLDTQVFEGVFLNPVTPTPPFGFDFERDEPGFHSSTAATVGQDLPADAAITLAAAPLAMPTGVATAFYWDGTGEVDFQPLASAQPGVDFTFAPAQFASTDSASFVDDHPLFGLTGGAADGVYLAGLSVEVEGLAASDPFAMVWLASSVLTDESTAEALEESLEAYEEGGPEPVVGGVNFAFFEEAVEFVESVPEPSAALLALVAATLVAKRR